MMHALASNLVHDSTIGRRQVQLGLAHGYALVSLSAVLSFSLNRISPAGLLWIL
jgi:hypothetical protein